MCGNKWILLWRSNSTLLAVVLAGGLAAKVLSAQSVTTLQSGAKARAIDKIQDSLATRLGYLQEASVVKSRLAADRVTIEQAASTVIPAFRSAGYSDQEAISGLAWTWYQLRAGPDAVPLTAGLSVRIIQEKAVSQGRLIVTSKPAGAAISVDRIDWPGATNAEGFADVGKRRVRVARDGLEPAEGICDVGRDRIATFSATLKKKGSEAQCK